ncbi:MAG: PorP/SprF family type IX secretion system membrane protein [Bacteroidia bacterium]|jgi:type IX secretion system PorP/SprF family membrane protein|nr:PorP/SprF family type IX secretion system membrane protein [Bacteroidia bacterium]
MRTKFITFSATLLLVGILKSQMGARIDQFYMDKSILIPAALAHEDDGHVSLYYNKLFTDIPGSPQHTAINATMPMTGENSSFGVFYMKENIAFSEMHNAYATYAYSFDLGSESKLSLGLSAGVLNQNFDPTKAVYYDDNDAKITALMFSPPVVRADLRSSIYFSTPSFYTGFSLQRLPQPTFDYTYYNYSASYDLQSQANFLLGFKTEIGDALFLKPAINVGMYNWDYLYADLNLSIDFQEKFWFGLGVNNMWQAGFNAGAKVGEDVNVGYSFKFPNGQQRGLLGPLHEFTASIGFGALGGGSGSRNNDDGEGYGSDNDYDGQSQNGGAKPYKEVTAKSLDDMVAFGTGNDPSGIKLPPIPKLKPAPGYYLAVGLHSDEEKANQQIIDLYAKDVLAFKFYDPRVKSYYVHVQRYDNEKDANKGEFYFTDKAPRVWVRKIK